MTFSNVSVFQNIVSVLNASPEKKVADKIQTGGAFAPNTMEAVALMRSNLDNDWETAFIIKYNALMQNRLNRLRQDLQNAYKALLEVSSVQQVRENGLTAENSSVTNVNGDLLNGAADAFKDLKYYENETSFNADDTSGGTWADAVPSYWEGSGDKTYEMRKLYVAGPALQIVNDMKVTMRTEEVPAKKATEDIDFGGASINISDLLGAAPYTAAQKVAEYSTEVKTGGFWSTINYLYNFAPRDLKYDYVTAYSTTSEQAGTRVVGGKQQTLFSRNLLDARDADDDITDINGSVPSYSNTSKPPEGARIKWVSSNPNDGYTTERSPIFDSGDAVSSSDNRKIVWRTVDGILEDDFDGDGEKEQWDNFGQTVRSDWDDFTDVASGQTLYGSSGGTTSSSGKDVVQYTEKKTVYGTEGGGDSKPLIDRIQWIYEHDGVGAADLDRDGRVDTNDVHVAKAAFINTYIISKRTSTLEGDGISVSTSELKRSVGIDGSAEHAANSKYKTVDGKSVLIQDDNSGDGYEDEDEDINDKLLLAGSGKISQTFNDTYIKNNHQIHTYNGQEISTNNADVRLSKNEDQVVIAEYEGFSRAKSMSLGMGKDYFSDGLNSDITRDQTTAFIKKLEMEANAAVNVVDTDWHYSQQKSGNSIMFRNITSVTDVEGDVHAVQYNSAIRNDSGADWENVDVAFRRTFNLKGNEFRTKNYSANFANGDVYLNTPTYTNKTFNVTVSAQNVTGNIDLMVNGNVVSVASGDTVNIGAYLREGENVIAAQVSVNSNANSLSSFSLVASGTDPDGVANIINSRISTNRSLNGDANLSSLNSSESSWQSKLMVEKIDTSNAAQVDSLSTIRTGTRVKEQNAFAKMLMDIINRPEYQDIFNLGLINVSAGKTISLKADVSAPSGGSIAATIDIQYDPVNRKFVLVQNKWDASGGT